MNKEGTASWGRVLAHDTNGVLSAIAVGSIAAAVYYLIAAPVCDPDHASTTIIVGIAASAIGYGLLTMVRQSDNMQHTAIGVSSLVVSGAMVTAGDDGTLFQTSKNSTTPEALKWQLIDIMDEKKLRQRAQLWASFHTDDSKPEFEEVSEFANLILSGYAVTRGKDIHSDGRLYITRDEDEFPLTATLATTVGKALGLLTANMSWDNAAERNAYIFSRTQSPLNPSLRAELEDALQASPEAKDAAWEHVSPGMQRFIISKCLLWGPPAWEWKNVVGSGPTKALERSLQKREIKVYLDENDRNNGAFAMNYKVLTNEAAWFNTEQHRRDYLQDSWGIEPPPVAGSREDVEARLNALEHHTLYKVVEGNRDSTGGSLQQHLIALLLASIHPSQAVPNRVRKHLLAWRLIRETDKDLIDDEVLLLKDRSAVHLNDGVRRVLQYRRIMFGTKDTAQPNPYIIHELWRRRFGLRDERDSSDRALEFGDFDPQQKLARLEMSYGAVFGRLRVDDTMGLETIVDDAVDDYNDFHDHLDGVAATSGSDVASEAASEAEEPEDEAALRERLRQYFLGGLEEIAEAYGVHPEEDLEGPLLVPGPPPTEDDLIERIVRKDAELRVAGSRRPYPTSAQWPSPGYQSAADVLAAYAG